MTHVALDVDPNEDVDDVREHVERNDLVGHFAVAPQDMIDALFEQFGGSIVSPPTNPMILVDADQRSARLLPRGFKSVEVLLDELE